MIFPSLFLLKISKYFILNNCKDFIKTQHLINLIKAKNQITQFHIFFVGFWSWLVSSSTTWASLPFSSLFSKGYTSVLTLLVSFFFDNIWLEISLCEMKLSDISFLTLFILFKRNFLSSKDFISFIYFICLIISIRF